MTTITSSAGVTSRPLLVVGFESSRPVRNVFHDVLTNAEPRVDVTLRGAGLRTGTLTYLYNSEALSLAAEIMHVGAFTFTLSTDVTSAAMKYAVDGQIVRTLDPETQAVWLLAVGFREVP